MWWLLGGVDSNRFLLLLIAPDYVCIECVYLEGPEPGRVRRQIEKVGGCQEVQKAARADRVWHPSAVDAPARRTQAHPRAIRAGGRAQDLTSNGMPM